jgi:hypothetical protein
VKDTKKVVNESRYLVRLILMLIPLIGLTESWRDAVRDHQVVASLETLDEADRRVRKMLHRELEHDERATQTQ